MLHIESKPEVKADVILAVLRRYANAWSTKDLDAVIALQRNLNRRTLKNELGSVKAPVMKLSPALPAQIQGERK